MSNNDDKIPKCIWGEKVIGKYSRRVYTIDKFEPLQSQVWLRECISGRLELLTLDQFFDNFEHYTQWYELGKNEKD